MIDKGNKCIYNIYTYYEWDEDKNAANYRKHGVRFEEASTVFSDPMSIVFKDWNHPTVEERFVILGISSSANILLVCHCLRGDGDIIRIISARKADKDEERIYERGYFKDKATD